MELREFVGRLPKVELHLHLVGAAPREAVAALAHRDPALLRGYDHYTDFPHFIECYKSVAGLIRSAGDVAFLAVALARELAAQSVRYAEVSVTPVLHERRGLAPEDVRDGLDEGARLALRDHGVILRWCYDIPAGSGLPGALRTAHVAELAPPDGLVSLGLGGVEAGCPRETFRPAFELARALGLHSVPHAGETSSAADVWQAVEALGAERIGHGIRAVDDLRLLDVLVDKGIVLEVCPTSNARTGAVASLAEHPLRRLIDAGVRVTLSSDDPAMFHTSITGEYLTAASTLGVSRDELAAIARTGIDAAFLSAEAKRRLSDPADR